ncbi:MAG: hypothetical protein M1305_02790 [Candidatus Marsarchaeota archaeon]|nr:hypothetical protein [Candidatus Marsarchaeota archaeon]
MVEVSAGGHAKWLGFVTALNYHNLAALGGTPAPVFWTAFGYRRNEMAAKGED